MNNLLSFYRDQLQRNLLPFWLRALDRTRGGVYTCYNNEGTELLSTDKFTWSQGRFVWILSRLADLCERGVLDERSPGGQAAMYLEHAGKTVRFLMEHVFLKNGNCAYVLTETGEKKELIPGQGYDLSFYADCFVVLGLTEFARVAGDRDVLERALQLYGSIERRLQAGKIRSEPYPVPDGYVSQSFAMIMLNVSQELAEALERAGHPNGAGIRSRSLYYMNEIMDKFVDGDDLLAELLPIDGRDGDTLLARQIAPGHSIECMWFVMKEARKLGLSETAGKAARVAKKAFDIGWDPIYGGLYRYVDRGGGEPQGRMIGDRYEALICDTWDMKIWWPHSEALYTFLLSYDLTQDSQFLDLYSRMHDYAFRTFPHPDPAIGEWIQIRDRQGVPIQKTVALPVKDPYHIMRNVLLTIELLDEKASATSTNASD
ncbi:Cellobiose 2-epimerase [Paenibacillus sp. CECT 9249]|uniref:AGE family epimerase/isomerase n=1 Tax=Paenibacillus sp. CECT 9249 TaxID=2845385 RepID=UPI001E4729DE|nr:AGE family epimerase/isomerase [Paenibacillus sp. CECT 9249]CAH0120176.1 Cellobiose 2-epimerase [Paenibacillus sp. CECT 9249]